MSAAVTVAPRGTSPSQPAIPSPANHKPRCVPLCSPIGRGMKVRVAVGLCRSAHAWCEGEERSGTTAGSSRVTGVYFQLRARPRLPLPPYLPSLFLSLPTILFLHPEKKHELLPFSPSHVLKRGCYASPSPRQSSLS